MAQRDDKFYSEVKQLNQDLFDYAKKCLDKSAYFDFTPTLQDYCKQFKEIEAKYPANSTNSTIPKPTTTSSRPSLFGTTTAPITTPSTQPSLFGTANVPMTTTSSQPFLFGTPNVSLTTTSSQPFLFGNPNVSLTTTTTSATTFPFFSFTAPLKKDEAPRDETQKADGQADDDEEHQPPEPKVDKYEEPDSSYSVKCKLYEKGNKTSGGEIPVNLLGIGTLYVKSLDNPAKLQVIVRQEPDLRRVLLNEVITPSIPVKLLPKAVQMIFPGSAGENKFYIAKVKDESDANTLHGFLNLSKS